MHLERLPRSWKRDGARPSKLQNIEKSLGDLRRRIVTETPVKNNIHLK